MSDPTNRDEPPKGRPAPRLRPTLDEDEQGRRSLDLIDALFDSASEDAEAHDGPVAPRARRMAERFQRLAADGYARAVARERLAAGSGSPGDGVPVSEDRGPDTAQLQRMDRATLVALILALQARRGGTPPVVTFEGIDDHELVQLARSLRAR